MWEGLGKGSATPSGTPREYLREYCSSVMSSSLTMLAVFEGRVSHESLVVGTRRINHILKIKCIILESLQSVQLLHSYAHMGTITVDCARGAASWLPYNHQKAQKNGLSVLG